MSSILDRLLRSTKVILKISDNRRGPMEYYLTARVNRTMFPEQLRLPVIDVDMQIRRVDSGLVTYAILDDHRACSRRAWMKLTHDLTDEEVRAYVTSIYECATAIAREKGLFDVTGEVYQVEAFD